MRIKENLTFNPSDYAGANEYAKIKTSDTPELRHGLSVITSVFAGVATLMAFMCFWPMGIVFLGVTVWLAISATKYGKLIRDIKGFNRQALIHNVKKKYQVDQVLLNAYGSIVNPDYNGLQKIHIDVDGQAYTFYLSQDAKTGEPTLSDPPINGGQALTPTVSAKDLLKTKTAN